MKYRVDFTVTSHIGLVRSVNQDNYIYGEYGGRFSEPYANREFFGTGSLAPQRGGLLGVFDGMGGEMCGETAAYIAAKAASGIKPEASSARAMYDFCRDTNREICDYAAKNGIASMGSTAAMLLFDRSGITLCNVGDSKVFRLSAGRLAQLSKDHLVAGAYGTKPRLYQHLGMPESETAIEPFFAHGGYHDGDIYLICSDGLTDMVGVEEIANVLKSFSLEEASKLLLKKALENGGKDNITFILCKVAQKAFISREQSKENSSMNGNKKLIAAISAIISAAAAAVAVVLAVIFLPNALKDKDSGDDIIDTAGSSYSSRQEEVVSDLPQSPAGTTTPNGTTTTPKDTTSMPAKDDAPSYGSMGSVTIRGVEYDIATTKKLVLTCGGAADDDLKDIAKLTNLTELLLHDNRISDITPLANLVNLTMISLSGNEISDITPLAKLTNLTELYLYDNQISDITPLAKLTNLTELNLGDNQISDITPLAKLTNLTELGLVDNQISDITPLEKLTNLTQLRLGENQISDITQLSNLTNLTTLNLSWNQIRDISPLANITNLTYLNLDHDQISDITPLANLTKLTELYLGFNQISDITPLAKLTNLIELDLSFNPITDEDIASLRAQLPNCYISV